MFAMECLGRLHLPSILREPLASRGNSYQPSSFLTTRISTPHEIVALPIRRLEGLCRIAAHLIVQMAIKVRRSKGPSSMNHDARDHQPSLAIAFGIAIWLSTRHALKQISILLESLQSEP
jgi:hypothetical protein